MGLLNLLFLSFLLISCSTNNIQEKLIDNKNTVQITVERKEKGKWRVHYLLPE